MEQGRRSGGAALPEAMISKGEYARSPTRLNPNPPIDSVRTAEGG